VSARDAASGLARADIAALAEHLRRVTVEVTDADQLLGGGVLWPAGCVVTNAHVVRRPEATLRLVDGRRLRARVLARDSDADLALLEVPGTGLPAATLADPDTIRIGAFVAAVGHPLGVRGALSTGIVCALGPIDRSGRPWIQADLHLAPGNSGGPLADAAGHLVGVNSRAAGPLALAVPMSVVRRFVQGARG
jgi:serine protease Do